MCKKLVILSFIDKSYVLQIKKPRIVTIRGFFDIKLEKSVFVRVCRRHLPNPRS